MLATANGISTSPAPVLARLLGCVAGVFALGVDAPCEGAAGVEGVGLGLDEPDELPELPELLELLLDPEDCEPDELSLGAWPFCELVDGLVRPVELGFLPG